MQVRLIAPSDGIVSTEQPRRIALNTTPTAQGLHPDQENLKGMMEDAGLDRVDYFNLSAGIIALHRGVKY